MGHGVLVQQFSGPGGFHVTAAELDGVTFEEPNLALREHDRIALSMLLEAHQPDSVMAVASAGAHRSPSII